MLSKKIAAIAAASLIGVSSVAAAQNAAPASAQATVVERSGAPSDDTNELRGTTGWIIGAIALGLLIWGAIELLDDSDSP